jgi:uncharacterized repeat protein (TIGR03803 family)
MKSTLTSTKAQLTALHHGSGTCAMTGLAPGRKAVLTLLLRLLWAAALVLPALGVRAGVILTTLHSFQPFPNGAGPSAGLVEGTDGSFYGTTQSGGTNGMYGTVFRVGTTGVLTSLHSFSGNDGANPRAELAQGRDGDFYGTTAYGGTNNHGTVFKITTKGYTGSSTAVNIPNTINRLPVTAIGQSAFAGCSRLSSMQCAKPLKWRKPEAKGVASPQYYPYFMQLSTS